MISRTNTTVLVLIALFTLAILYPTPVTAQNAVDRERVRSELDRTDEIIHEATDVVHTSRSQKGRLKIERAMEIQAKAKEAYDQTHYQLALKLTLEAREEANQALGLARLENRIEERLRRMSEETIEHLANVRDIMVEANIKDLQTIRLAEESKALLEKAQENAHQLRFQLALKLVETARQRAIQAEQHVRRVLAVKQMNERRLALIERLIERARERIHEGTNAQIMQQLHLAEEQYNRARELQREGRYRAARINIEKCEKTLRSLARRLTQRRVNDPEAMLRESYRLLERAGQIIAEEGDGTGSARQIRLVEQAQGLLTRAENAIDAGRYEEAQRLITRTRRLLRQAIREERRDETAERVVSMIEQVEKLRTSVLEMLPSCTAPGTETLMERATNRLERAKMYLEEGRIENAAAEARIARNMYNRIKEICSTL
jgi:tetratricopeptide (TPR) repeat protein